ncbi:MAG: carbohydrate ABC transporter permease [Lachnospiraceae bacterium]|nr:carbohydrate ABC transporter permease [Lachnospiraceae bacterium]
MSSSAISTQNNGRRKEKIRRLNRLYFADYVMIGLGLVVIMLCITPLLNLAAKSLSSADALVAGKVFLIPKGLNLSAYKMVFGNSKYVHSLWYTALLTLAGTILSLTMTTLCAFPLIFDKLKGRWIFNIIITITMFFNAGTIPNYLLMVNLKLLDTVWVLLVPFCLSVFNMIIMRSFFYGIPISLRESAELDGASFFKILWHVYLPLSKPVIATLALFYAVGRWNGYSDALMYVKKESLFPIQLYLYNIISGMSSMEVAIQDGYSTPGLSGTMKAAVVMFSTIPILLIYPWLQRYFIQGVTVGAVKE